jgi:predicted transposase/invertase (TIGR01784 family)
MTQENSLPPYLHDPLIMMAAEKAVREGKLLDLKSDVVFKSLFTKPAARPALTSLLSAVIAKDIANVSVLNAEILPEYLTGKTVRMDIHCLCNGGEEADIEMQVARGNDNQVQRALLYACKLGSGQLESGVLYRDLMPFYQIMFTDFVLFPHTPAFHSIYTLKDEKGRILADTMTLHFLELPKLRKRIEGYRYGKTDAKTLQSAEKWAIFLKYHDDANKQGIIHELCQSEEGIMSAEAVLQMMSVDKEEWAKEMFRVKREFDYRADMHSAEAKGERKKALEAARNLLQMGDSVEKISQATGLSLDEITAL